MLSNMTKVERRTRFTVGIIIWALYLTGSIAGGLAHFLAVLGVIFIATAVMNYCPYYLLFELTSSKDTQT